MKQRWGAWGGRALVLGCLFMAVTASYAQIKPAAASAEATREVLVAKAHALEARGRPDMALQLWQQVLLSEPNNPEALAGLARDFKLMGKVTQANSALAHLRTVSPNDPNIARIEAMSSTAAESDQLKRQVNWRRPAGLRMPCASTSSSMAMIPPTGPSPWPTTRPFTPRLPGTMQAWPE